MGTKLTFAQFRELLKTRPRDPKLSYKTKSGMLYAILDKDFTSGTGRFVECAGKRVPFVYIGDGKISSMNEHTGMEIGRGLNWCESWSHCYNGTFDVQVLDPDDWV